MSRTLHQTTATSTWWCSLPSSFNFQKAPASFPSPDSLRVLQWNAGGLRARSTELLYFLPSHPVDLIGIQKPNLNSSSSFRIPEFSALRSDRTHSQSGILPPDAITLTAVSSFSSGKAYPFLNFLPPLFL